MELKQGITPSLTSGIRLLIVPYGIETSHCIVFKALFLLLIVPYGIETEYFLHFPIAPL